jgi:hypothetical protein
MTTGMGTALERFLSGFLVIAESISAANVFCVGSVGPSSTT